MDRLLIACADVGSVVKGNFGCADSDGDEGANPSDLAIKAARALTEGRPVALGFECPLFVPLPHAERELGKARIDEGARPWSAGAGCGALATGLVQATWTLTEIRNCCPAGSKAHLDWSNFKIAGGGLLLWEAFVSGVKKGADHVGDARRAVSAFEARLPRPETNIVAENPVSLAAVALLRAGWPVGLDALTQPCLAIKA